MKKIFIQYSRARRPAWVDIPDRSSSVWEGITGARNVFEC